MVIDKQKVCVIVPFYNEEQVINKVVSELLSHNYKVLAVDDGSSDKSYENIQDLKCTIIRHPQNFGQGAALQTGMSFAKLNPNLEIFVTFDSDGQHQVANIENVLNPLIRDEADIVFGTRFQDDLTKFTFLKRLILR
jgi:glycosyltransferase involved in cell wall biosynthesis